MGPAHDPVHDRGADPLPGPTPHTSMTTGTFPPRPPYSRYPYIRRIAKSTICSTAFASKTIRWSPSMSRTKP